MMSIGCFIINQYKIRFIYNISLCSFPCIHTVFVCLLKVCASPTWFSLSIWRFEPSSLADSITPLLRSHQYRRWEPWSTVTPLGDTRPVLTTTSRISLFRPDRSTAGRLPMSVQYTFLQTHRWKVHVMTWVTGITWGWLNNVIIISWQDLGKLHRRNMQFQRSYCAWGCRAMPLGFWMSLSIKISLSRPFKLLQEIEDNLKSRILKSVVQISTFLRKCVCIRLQPTLYQSSIACDGPSLQPDPRVSRVQWRTASLWSLHPVKPSQYASGLYLQNTPKQTNKPKWLLPYETLSLFGQRKMKQLCKNLKKKTFLICKEWLEI